MQKIITLDSQILNTTQLCERRTKLTFIDGLQPSQKAEPLERGDLMHKMLEIYESLRCDMIENSKTWTQVREAEIRPFSSEDNPKDYAILAGRIFATKMDLAAEEIEATIFQFSEYIEYYKNDPWETLALEAVGTKLLFEDELFKILYSFKIDRLAKRDQIIAPWDYKTSKQRKQTSTLSNQFIGYAWATDSNYVVVDKIGFQKTLKPEERFQRIFLSYDNERIDEWVKNSVQWALAYANILRHPEETTMNLTSCDKYNGCIYRPICERTPSSREWIIQRDYVVGEKWDPANDLEMKEHETQS